MIKSRRLNLSRDAAKRWGQRRSSDKSQEGEALTNCNTSVPERTLPNDVPQFGKIKVTPAVYQPCNTFPIGIDVPFWDFREPDMTGKQLMWHWYSDTPGYEGFPIYTISNLSILFRAWARSILASYNPQFQCHFQLNALQRHRSQSHRPSVTYRPSVPLSASQCPSVPLSAPQCPSVPLRDIDHNPMKRKSLLHHPHNLDPHH